MESKLINLFGGPSIGKSGIAAGITYHLKKRHISCNNPYEFPKQIAYDDNLSAIKDQGFIFANQHRGIVQCYGKVEYIIVDSPVLFSLIYNNFYTKGYPAELYNESFNNLVLDTHRYYDNTNILLKRNPINKHNSKERFQNTEQSLQIDALCKQILDDNNIPYYEIEVNQKTVKKILRKFGILK